MKTITAHLLEFTLIHYYGSNKSELARKLGMRRNDFSRIYDRCMAGEGGSLTALESLLNLYCTEGFSIDEAMSDYSEGGTAALSEKSCAMCRVEPRALRERLLIESRTADQRAQVFRSAERLIAQIERTFCTTACPIKDTEEETCPCQRLCELVEWIKAQMPDQ